MANSTVLILCLVAIIISIVISYKTKINLGLLAMAFAFIIGTLGKGMKVSAIFSAWPDSIVFFMISSSIFFSFAAQNGTILKFGEKMLWAFRHNVKIIPWAIFLVSAVIAFLGANLATTVFLQPIAFAIGLQVGFDPILMVCSVCLGQVAGSANPWTGSGVVVQGLIEQNGVVSDMAFKMAAAGYANIVIHKVMFMIIYFIFYMFIKKRSKKSLDANRLAEVIKEPEPFTPLQKKTFALILIAFVLIVVPSIINTWGSVKSPFFKNFCQLCQPQSVMIIFAIIAAFMNMGDPKKAVKAIPISTIVMISGVTFLIEVAKKADLINTIGGWFNTDTPAILVPPVLCFLAGFISLFASATSVACPLLFPLVPALAASTGLSAAMLYTTIYIGANVTAMSPFSTGGAMVIGVAPDELKDKLPAPQMILAATMLGLAMLSSMIGLFGIVNV